MKTFELDPSSIITLNDYPVHSDEVLTDYFDNVKAGNELPLVPVMRKDAVRSHLGDTLLKEFEQFEADNPTAEYFMLDGSHRTTAQTLAGHQIRVVLYESDEDVAEARKLVADGQILANDTLDHTLVENCEILREHFEVKTHFETVRQKTERMVNDEILPTRISKGYKEVSAPKTDKGISPKLI